MLAEIETTKVTWKLVGYIPEGRSSCHLCGHEIKRLFYVRSSTGVTEVVGSECVNTLLEPDQRVQAELLDRRTNRAARQWREKLPAPLPEEMREQYINRRVAEMANARAAFNVYLAKGREIVKLRDTLFKEREAEIKRLWPLRSAENREYDLLLAKTHADAEEPFLREIEGSHKANRFDFTRRAAWNVRKI